MNFKSILTPFINFEIVKTIPQHNDQAVNYDSFVYIFSKSDEKKFKTFSTELIKEEALPFNEAELLDNLQSSIYFVGIRGPVWILCESGYDSFRDKMGGIATQIKNLKFKNPLCIIEKINENEFCGLITGLELSLYHFLQVFKNEIKANIHFNLFFKEKSIVKNKAEFYLNKFQINAKAIQIARHLVNLPPNLVHPESLEKQILKDLNFSPQSQIEVWDQKKCEKEGLNLLLAVGAGAQYSPRLVCIKYRPKNLSKIKKSPIAFVGKGITFDTGGLDIKPSSAMRLMKKDMGGAAAIFGLAYWVDHVKYENPCDFYLALAENAIDAKSMRPSDVYKSHAGYLVEIDNTDAEGRLVLADAMSVAICAQEKPKVIIDVATLTGAIKVALGTQMAGLFSNNDLLANQLFEAGQKAGEPNWRMPLVKKYWSSLSSTFADFKNSGEGFGGAITAALFLEKFAGAVPWAHLDIYSWADRPEGAISSTGGNGQAVQTLIQYLEDL